MFPCCKVVIFSGRKWSDIKISILVQNCSGSKTENGWEEPKLEKPVRTLLQCHVEMMRAYEDSSSWDGEEEMYVEDAKEVEQIEFDHR